MKTVTGGKAFLISGSFSAVAAIAMLGAGCDNNHLLGAVDGGPPSQDSGSPPGTDGGGLDVPKVDPTQSWTGYIENYQFASGSDAVKISFASDTAGQLVGTVILGNGTPPPPPTDPNVGYPADLTSGPGGPVTIGPPMYIAEGFPFTMKNGTLTGRRLQFGVSLLELWKAWCAIETPVDNSGTCLPNWGGMISPDGTCAELNPATNQYEQVDCGKLQLCHFGMVCRCDLATSTCALQDNGPNVMFDVSITNDLADGSVAGLGNHNVHFTKDPS